MRREKTRGRALHGGSRFSPSTGTHPGLLAEVAQGPCNDQASPAIDDHAQAYGGVRASSSFLGETS
jgi:hypothetical protein